MSEQLIFQAMHKAMDELCRLGIGKTKKNTQQGYNFRGIDEAMSELSPILVRNKIIVAPKYVDIKISERVKGDPADGKAMRFAEVKGIFTFYALDGSSVVSEFYGEAMDSGDKAVTKAQSVAYRTALFQTFVVPLMAMDPESSEYEQSSGEPEELAAAQEIAMDGRAALTAWWKKQTPAVRAKLAKYVSSLGQAADAADKDRQ